MLPPLVAKTSASYVGLNLIGRKGRRYGFPLWIYPFIRAARFDRWTLTGTDASTFTPSVVLVGIRLQARALYDDDNDPNKEASVPFFQKEFGPMITQPMRLVVPLVLCILLAPPAAAQEEGVFEGSPTDFLPLQVGNQWTYEHTYWNALYYFNFLYPFEQDFYWAEPGSLKRLVVRAMFEIPGYPYYPDMQNGFPGEPEGASAHGEFTIEITHTEMIEGQEYFVFSDIEYDWPPVPNLFLAGQKVRFSDEGTLLFRWQGQDIPLYAFRDSDCCSPEYPVLQNENLPVKQFIQSFFIPAENLGGGIERVIYRMEFPPSLSQASVAGFQVEFREELREELKTRLFLGSVEFLAGYGLFSYHRSKPGYGDLPMILTSFENDIRPVSAVIGGKKLEFSYTPIEWTSVQPTSWGQLKARHRQRP